MNEYIKNAIFDAFMHMVYKIKTMKRPTQYPGLSADQFRDILARLGWSQADFADRTGLTRPTVSRWATGSTSVPPWATSYLDAMLDLAALRDKYLTAPKRTGSTNDEQPQPVPRPALSVIGA